MGRYKDAVFHSPTLHYSFYLNVIAQLHVYHPWYWQSLSFSESPHKTLIYKSLAEISPLAKLPSQAVDFQTQCLQSAAQHGILHGTEHNKKNLACMGHREMSVSSAEVPGYPTFTSNRIMQSSQTSDKTAMLMVNYRIRDEVRVDSFTEWSWVPPLWFLTAWLRWEEKGFLQKSAIFRRHVTLDAIVLVE